MDIKCGGLVTACTLAVLFAIALSSRTKPSIDTDAKTRAIQTLGGYFDYYWKQDPSHPEVKFFFACGQIGQFGSGSEADQCVCNDPKVCLNCYRWWSAVAVESIATYGIYMNTTNNSDVADITFDHSAYNSNWQPENAFIDDFLWYGITYLRVYEWLNDTKWLTRSTDLYDWAWKYGWKVPCGGIIWCYDETRSFKDNIQLTQAMHLSAKLAYTLPNVTKYLDNAKTIWDWFFSYNGGRGIVTEQNILSTGLVPERCCNATSDSFSRCQNSNVNGTAYQQGIFLSAAAYMYLCTGNKSYIDAAVRVIEAVIANYTVNGVLRDEPRSYQSYSTQCMAGADPGGDWYSFNGVFMLHLSYFVDVLTKNGTMPADTLKKITTFVQTTSDSAWMNSSSWPPFDNSNGCAAGSKPASGNATYPKFHWWWGKDVEYQETPPDPRYYFHKFKVRCHTSGKPNTQLWEGMIGSELKCTQLCDKYPNCSKYLYQLNQDEVKNYDCWLWSYSRTDHLCDTLDNNWNIGTRRPIGNATCTGKCGSKVPQSLDKGVCYCDDDCAKYLDCCIDYVDMCRKDEPVTCKGVCNTANAVALQGGGYCWCDTNCNPSFTDNNSDGSCCADYPQQCLKVKMPPCLDARTQGSAFNLFLGHIAVSKDTKWLTRSTDLYDWAWKYGWKVPCGGIIWCYDETRSFKDNIQLTQAMHLSAKLAYTLPNVTKYLDNAKTIWDWFFSYNGGRGIVTEQNILSTGLVPERCCNATSDSFSRCRNSNVNGTAYQQGIFLSAAAYMYLCTGNKSYIDAAVRVIEAVIANYTVNGVLRDEPRSYQSYTTQCMAGADPGGDWYSFNGVFMLHLSYFVDVLTKNGTMPADTLKKITTFVQTTSDSAWMNSSSWPPFDKSNGCAAGSKPASGNATYPKFHWWWGKDVEYQETPPDPRYYFHKFKLKCFASGDINTELWVGEIGSELKCTQLCNKYPNCSKYLYQLNHKDVPKVDCYLWSYNRSNHICATLNDNWNVGIRRPIGNATCAGKCGSQKPQSLDQGICYCDNNCAKHLDCCIDYVDMCRKDEPVTCKGVCNTASAVALQGGGYCWCDTNCNPSFTDNNSDGSCCADYPQQCLKVKMPPCLDARTQGSAFNLFLAHMTMSKVMT